MSSHYLSFILSSIHFSVDATEESNHFGRLLNHSRSGNLCPKVYVVEDEPHLIFLARKSISKGEELTYDYGDRDKEAIRNHPFLKL